MSQPTDMPNLLDPLGMWRASQDAMFETWSKSMVDFVNTEAYAAMSGSMLDAYLTLMAPVRKAMEQTMTPLLAQLNLPSRAEVASLAERMTHIELRLDDLDARLDTLSRLLQRTEESVQALAEVSSARAQRSTRSTPAPTAQPAAKSNRRTARAPASTRRSPSSTASRGRASTRGDAS